jgi:hypothetical protein
VFAVVAFTVCYGFLLEEAHVLATRPERRGRVILAHPRGGRTTDWSLMFEREGGPAVSN